MRIVLASASSARRAMLAAASVGFEVAVAEVDEVSVKARGGMAQDVAAELAAAKAVATSSAYQRDQEILVIGSDQTLELDGHIFSKAASVLELRKNLMRLRGRTHALYSAVAVARDGEIVWSHIDTAHLKMRAFSDAFLDDYVAEHGEQVRSSLGGYWFEAEGAQLFDVVDGDYFTILGMPLLPLLGFLRGVGALAS